MNGSTSIICKVLNFKSLLFSICFAFWRSAKNSVEISTNLFFLSALSNNLYSKHPEMFYGKKLGLIVLITYIYSSLQITLNKYCLEICLEGGKFGRNAAIYLFSIASFKRLFTESSCNLGTLTILTSWFFKTWN